MFRSPDDLLVVELDPTGFIITEGSFFVVVFSQQ